MDLICLQIDLARQKEKVEYVKSFIDFAKENNYNTVVMYLEAAIRTDCSDFFDEASTYSAEEIREFVNYGNSVGIQIIPAFENLSHLDKFTRYKQLEDISECENDVKDGRGFFGGRSPCGCISNPSMYEFLDKYLSEVIPLFDSKYVHMGMDETFDFAVCPKCRKRLRNGETKKSMFLEHVLHTYNLVKSLGKTMMMWDDMFQYMDIVEDLPKDVILCNWNYGYIGDEPDGHWINRKKRDWFRYYDSLGLKYLYCIYAHSASSTFNLDSFSKYANKYNPIGALMTNWGKSDNFYQRSYPYLAYAGRLWSGKASAEDKVEIYAEYLGSEEAAEIIASMQAKGCVVYGDVSTICENDNSEFAVHFGMLKYATKKLYNISKNVDNEEKRDVLLDIYCYLLDKLLDFELQKLGIEMFDNYETKKINDKYFFDKLDDIKKQYEFMRENEIRMWQKYRDGIISYNNDFDKGFAGRIARIEKIKKDVVDNKNCGVFYSDILVHDCYGTPRMRIDVHYADNTPDTVHKCIAKPKLTSDGGYSTIRFIIKNNPIDSIDFSVFGEGAVYPLNFRYTQNGTKYIVNDVQKVSGNVKKKDKILLNDTQFAEMGYNDGQRHFDDVTLCRKISKIKMKFNKFC